MAEKLKSKKKNEATKTPVRPSGALNFKIVTATEPDDVSVAGAAVEEGIYTADSNRGDPISEYERTMTDIGLYGLDLETKGLPSDVHAQPVAAMEAQPETREPELPDWATETPHECEYTLQMDEGGMDCQSCQTIDLTRQEFLQLKMYLARLRGVQIPREKPEGFEPSEATCNLIWTELEPEEIAAVPEVAHA